MFSSKDLKLVQEKGYSVVLLAESLGSLAILRELGKNHIPCIVIGNEFVKRSRFTTVAVEANSLTEVCKKLYKLPKILHVELILMTDSDKYLDLIYSEWDYLCKYYLIPTDLNNNIVTNKKLLAQHGENLGINIPKTYEKVEYVKEELLPVIVKPIDNYNVNSKLKKAYICYSLQQLNEAIYLVESADSKYIIQQYIVGKVEHLYNALVYRCRKGEILTGFTCKKVRSYPLEYGTGTIHKFIQNDHIVRMSIQIMEEVNYFGVAEFEYKYCSHRNEYFLIEVNGRFPLHSSLLHKTNPLFIHQIIGDLLDEPTKDVEVDKGKFSNLVWIYFINDMRAIEKKKILYSYLQLVLRNKVQWALWNIKDPIPSIFYFKHLIRKYKKTTASRHP
ncbi:hypothetical protein ACLIA0_13370 [Bacillaceae bacterium W0354]